MAQIYKNPLVLSREIQEDEFDPDAIDVNNPEHRKQLVNFYLTDMWGYTPEQISAFKDDDIDESTFGIYDNVNLQDMRKKWSPEEIRGHILSLRGGK